MSSPIEIEVLGSGTSQGVPVIGCHCKVCTSTNPKDKRLRSSILIKNGETQVLIDCGPDFRTQALRSGTEDLDAVIFTHEHNDHVAGVDDLRPIIFRKPDLLTLYATPRVLESLKARYHYAFEDQPYPGVPTFAVEVIDENSLLQIEDIAIQIFPVWHGQLKISGLRVGSLAYITDVKTIPEESMMYLNDLDYLIIDALHHRDHHSHLTLKEAIEVAKNIGAKQTYFTHCSHQIGLYEEVNASLPTGMNLAFDTLKIVLD